MRILIVLLFTVISVNVFSQRTLPPGTRVLHGVIPDAKRMRNPPIFPNGADSLLRFYFSHFTCFDSLLTKAIERGDTAKYIRLYFSFVIDENGAATESQFIRVASTQYAKSEGARTIPYFMDDKPFYDACIKAMIYKMPFWKPGVLPVRYSNSMVASDARVEDYIQFWVGINPPTN
jgi:hypothetical protein